MAGRAEAIAITSVFAPVSDEHERKAEEIVRKELGDVSISLSSQIGSLGLLERENATVLNASLTDVARGVTSAIGGALERHGLRPVTYFAQNDGTLMDLEFAIRFPVLTIGSGPANSIRGAAYLTGRTDAIVVDVGGTSTDVGVLVRGFPRESSFGVEIGGIRTNFRMPDLVTIALGGGTIVTEGAARSRERGLSDPGGGTRLRGLDADAHGRGRRCADDSRWATTRASPTTARSSQSRSPAPTRCWRTRSIA